MSLYIQGYKNEFCDNLKLNLLLEPSLALSLASMVVSLEGVYSCAAEVIATFSEDLLSQVMLICRFEYLTSEFVDIIVFLPQSFDDGLDKRDGAANHDVRRLGSLQSNSPLLVSYVAVSLPAPPQQLQFLTASVDGGNSANPEGLIPSNSLQSSDKFCSLQNIEVCFC